MEQLSKMIEPLRCNGCERVWKNNGSFFKLVCLFVILFYSCFQYSYEFNHKYVRKDNDDDKLIPFTSLLT